MKYSGRWTAGLNDQEKKNFEDLLGVNNKVLDRLAEICYNMLNSSEIDSDDYGDASWAYKQADKVGFRRALKQVMTLCKQVEQRDPVASRTRKI
jgi:hypothetical protein